MVERARASARCHLLPALYPEIASSLAVFQRKQDVLAYPFRENNS